MELGALQEACNGRYSNSSCRSNNTNFLSTITRSLLVTSSYKMLPVAPHRSLHTITHMESKPRYRPSTIPVSVAKWLPRLSSFFPLRDNHDAATLRSLPAPGSLRDAHDAACAWFLGPKAENADYFRMSVDTILNDVIHCRRNFAPEDEVCVRLLDYSQRLYQGSILGFRRCGSHFLV